MGRRVSHIIWTRIPNVNPCQKKLVSLQTARAQGVISLEHCSVPVKAVSMSAQQVAPELTPIKTKLEGIIGELKQLQASGSPTQAQVETCCNCSTQTFSPYNNDLQTSVVCSVAEPSP